MTKSKVLVVAETQHGSLRTNDRECGGRAMDVFTSRRSRSPPEE